MPFGTDNLDYGEGFGNEEDQFGSGGTGYSGLDTEAQYGGSVYDEYMGDALASEDVDIGDYLYTYDPLKEQNLLADYMSGLTELGDKTEGVRTKAISERKALSKSIRGGLSSGSMADMSSQQKDDASRAQASLYRGQESSKRALGENIGSLREQYEGDIAESVDSYNEKVGGTGATYDELSMTSEDSIFQDYATEYGFNLTDQPSGTESNGLGEGGKPFGFDMGASMGDTWMDTTTGEWFKYHSLGGWHPRGTYGN